VLYPAIQWPGSREFGPQVKTFGHLWEGVTRLDGARGKKQVWRPNVRTWGLSEANVLRWRMYLWQCWDFSASPQLFRAPAVLWHPENCAPLPPRYAAAPLIYMNWINSHNQVEDQPFTFCRRFCTASIFSTGSSACTRSAFRCVQPSQNEN